MPGRILTALALLFVLGLLSGCAVVSVKHDASFGQARGDILSSGTLGRDTRSTLLAMGIDPDDCQADAAGCLRRLDLPAPLSHEQKFAAMAEIALAATLAPDAQEAASSDEAIAAQLDVARYAYAYLFHSEHTPAQRALEGRQAAVQAYYDHAVEQIALRLFERTRTSSTPRNIPRPGQVQQVGGWTLTLSRMELQLPSGATQVEEIVPTSGMSIEGMRNVYGRDGLGAALVAVARPSDAASVANGEASVADSGIGYVAATLIVDFPATGLDQLMASRQVRLEVLDPYRSKTTVIAGIEVPVTANFTAPYALWLARSGFGRQAVASVFGRSNAIHRARLFMMQPYDPSRLTIIMLHGLASSPEAWTNLANEVVGDESLRDRYQVWQVYYPTNLPIAENRRDIAQLLESTRSALDPGRTTPATNDTVLIGHSMGGVLARLLVVDSGERLWEEMFDAPAGSAKRQRLAELEPYVSFKPMPGVTRAIFLASPHAGSPTAGNWLNQVVARLIRLPRTLVGRVQQLADLVAADQPELAQFMRASPNALKGLDSRSPYLRATSRLDISPAVTYHSIIARKKPAEPLEQSSDGLLPYTSAHLPGAQSELVITSGHSVQETPEAILEIRRILREHAAIAAGPGRPHTAAP